eukprot:284819696_1
MRAIGSRISCVTPSRIHSIRELFVPMPFSLQGVYGSVIWVQNSSEFFVMMLPMPDELVVIKVTASQLKVLETSVSQYPKTEGRFLQVPFPATSIAVTGIRLPLVPSTCWPASCLRTRPGDATKRVSLSAPDRQRACSLHE